MFASDSHALWDEINAGMLQFTKKWNWKWIVKHRGYLCRKLPTTNISSAPKYMYLQGRSLKFK